MQIAKTAVAFIIATIATYFLAATFYTQQVLAKQAEIGAVYTPAQTIETYIDNVIGLALGYGLVIMIGLAIAFPVAWGLKKILTPLAPAAYPLAGAAAVFAAIYLIENIIAGGGVGALAGARGGVGLALQCLAGFVGGGVFAMLRPR